MPADDAAIAADAMIWADLRGLPQHGVGEKLGQCVARVRAGLTNPETPLRVVAELGALTLFDAGTGWGTIAATRAMRRAVENARGHGIGLSVVRDASSAAAMGYYPSIAIEAGMIGMAITNGPPLMAPWGGTGKLLGNQGYAIGCPAGSHAPIVFDTSLGSISTGQIHQYEARGEELPPGVALDAEGRPTRDPATALTGLMAPAGGHRGSGMAVMWEILTGVLGGGEVFGPAVRAPGDLHGPQGVSLFLLAIDPSAFGPLETFTARVDALADQLTASPRAADVERITLPGERRLETSVERARGGVPMAATRVAALRDLGAELDVELWGPPDQP
jgi:LDH2 family malate/lactate/ureidoglycolate dehydrogenase